ncbi:hypothetical protein [Chondromyces apiculatus]|uniref:Uncharacterized protein n=1 Tax=Chondromyces apiculatus DSM 436 TaxID=1192034 RepID=A0A017TE25_9BACT|nr:hypothetical protein [Chondromyces apiculatus]EYF07528.1 Hypothetical protein CAP_0281 [Chondromyces apiculatus DSM 436]
MSTADDAPAPRSVESLFQGASSDPEAALWAHAFGTDLRAAWQDAPRAGWLMWMAAACKVDKRAYMAAGLRCAEEVLKRLAEIPEEVRIAHRVLSAWAGGMVSEVEARKTFAQVNALASGLAGRQGDPPNPERARRRRLSAGVRCVARAVEDGLGEFSAIGAFTWPTAGYLARHAVEDAGVDLAAFDRAGCDAVRSTLAPWEPPPTLPAQQSAPPPPCYVEVTFTDAAAWALLARTWNDVGHRKSRGKLHPEAQFWARLALRPREESLGSLGYQLYQGEYRLEKAVQLSASSGQLRFTPLAFPYGGTGPIRAMAELYGCRVSVVDDGLGPVERVPAQAQAAEGAAESGQAREGGAEKGQAGKEPAEEAQGRAGGRDR